MNLSSRLDAARRQREQGKAKELDPSPLDLRYVEDGQTYDGHELRTGEELTPERWEELRRREEGLPKWQPRPRPGESFAESASLIDLTQVGAPPPPPPVSGDTIELPPWAHQDVVAPPPSPQPSAPERARPNSCANCGGEPRVDVVDMHTGLAHLECTGCGFKWQARTEHRRWPGRTSNPGA